MRNWIERESAAERLERWSIPEPNSGCILWLGCTFAYGHGRLTWRGQHFLAHRLSYEVANGPIPPRTVVRHKCDNPFCINPAHLEIGTQADNIADMYARSRHVQVRGEKVGGAKITPEIVREMRSLYPAASYEDIGRRFGVSMNCAREAIIGHTWGHV